MARMRPMDEGIHSIGSSATRYPYEVQARQFKNVVKLVVNGMESVLFSLTTIYTVARGDPMSRMESTTPMRPRECRSDLLPR